jgi:hypothetical protein
MSAEEEPLPADWWSVDDVLRYLRSEGAPIARDTWNGYVSRDQAPRPDRYFGRSPAWLPATIRDYHNGRPRKGLK